MSLNDLRVGSTKSRAMASSPDDRPIAASRPASHMVWESDSKQRGWVKGIVELGDQRGRTLGFPTANIPVEAPASDEGVWAGRIERRDGTCHYAAISIGNRPTFYLYGGLRLLEAHILDFCGDLYGELITVTLEHWLRNQRTFESRSALVRQIARDVRAVRSLSKTPRLITTWNDQESLKSSRGPQKLDRTLIHEETSEQPLRRPVTSSLELA